MPHSGSLGIFLPSMKHKVHLDGTHGQSSSRMSTSKVTSLHSAAKSQVARCLLNVRCYTLSLREITLVSFDVFEVGCQTATLYQLADGSTVLKLGLDEDVILMKLSVSTYHGPHIGCQFLVTGFTSPFTGRWHEHWAHGKCGLKPLQWQL